MVGDSANAARRLPYAGSSMGTDGQDAEMLGALRFGEIIDLPGEIAAQALDGTRVGVDGPKLQPL